MAGAECTTQLELFEVGRQQVYQVLAGYPDGNDAQQLRYDPLVKTLVGVDPGCDEQPLASGSTINRFQHDCTRREARFERCHIGRKGQAEGTLGDGSRNRSRPLIQSGRTGKGHTSPNLVSLASHWPGRELLTTAIRVATAHTRALQQCWREQHLFVSDEELLRRRCLSRAPAKIVFAPLPLKQTINAARRSSIDPGPVLSGILGPELAFFGRNMARSCSTDPIADRINRRNLRLQGD